MNISIITRNLTKPEHHISSKLLPELKKRIERAGNTVSVLPVTSSELSDIRIDLTTDQLYRSEWATQKNFYVLCFDRSANDCLGWANSSHRNVIGFSIIPPFTNSSILEIARPLQTPIAELEKARTFFESLGFTVVEVPDGPGLIQARIVACLANEAMSALSEGVADARTIDTAMKLGTNYPLGPLEWAELIGLESILAIMEGLQSEYGEDRYRPHPLLRRLVAAGLSVVEYEAQRRGE